MNDREQLGIPHRLHVPVVNRVAPALSQTRKVVNAL